MTLEEYLQKIRDNPRWAHLRGMEAAADSDITDEEYDIISRTIIAAKQELEYE